MEKELEVTAILDVLEPEPGVVEITLETVDRSPMVLKMNLIISESWALIKHLASAAAPLITLKMSKIRRRCRRERESVAAEQRGP